MSLMCHSLLKGLPLDDFPWTCNVGIEGNTFSAYECKNYAPVHLNVAVNIFTNIFAG